MEPRLKAWAEEVADLIKSNGGNKRVAVDKLEPA